MWSDQIFRPSFFVLSRLISEDYFYQANKLSNDFYVSVKFLSVSKCQGIFNISYVD